MGYLDCLSKISWVVGKSCFWRLVLGNSGGVGRGGSINSIGFGHHDFVGWSMALRTSWNGRTSFGTLETFTTLDSLCSSTTLTGEITRITTRNAEQHKRQLPHSMTKPVGLGQVEPGTGTQIHLEIFGRIFGAAQISSLVNVSFFWGMIHGSIISWEPLQGRSRWMGRHLSCTRALARADRAATTGMGHGLDIGF